MAERGFTELDWITFQKLFPNWQEAYMGRLLEEYASLLAEGTCASERFWELDKRIKSDRRKNGVIVTNLSRSTFQSVVVSLLQEGAITFDDLHEFSDNFKESVECTYKI